MSDPLDDEKIRKALEETARKLAEEMGLDPDKIEAQMHKLHECTTLDQYRLSDDTNKSLRTEYINETITASVEDHGGIEEQDIVQAIKDGVPHEALYTLTAMALSKPLAVAVMYPVIHLMGCMPEKMRNFVLFCLLDESTSNPQRFDELLHSMLTENRELFNTYRRGFNRIWVEERSKNE
jgi:hypothetical protein